MRRWPYLEWYDVPGRSTYNLPMSDAHTWVGNVDDDGLGLDPPCGEVVHHMRGQWDVSDQANKKLMISYFCRSVFVSTTST